MPTPDAHHREIIAGSLAEHDLAELAPRILELAEPCLRLRTRPHEGSVLGTKIGGDPELPPSATRNASGCGRRDLVPRRARRARGARLPPRDLLHRAVTERA